MTVYDRIKSRRLELKMSQQELADKTGYKTRSAINKIESGLRDIGQKKIKQFAVALDVTPAYLMGWEENKKRIQDEISSLKLQIKSDTYSEDTSAIQKQFIEKYSNLVFKLKDPEVSIADKNAILKMFVDEIIYNKNSATVDIAYFL